MTYTKMTQLRVNSMIKTLLKVIKTEIQMGFILSYNLMVHKISNRWNNSVLLKQNHKIMAIRIINLTIICLRVYLT